MVNQVVLEYLRTNRGNYKLEDLKKKILSSGYSQKDINDALFQLNKEGKGRVPSVSATINKINQTNIPFSSPIPQQNISQVPMNPDVGSGKKKSWLKWLLIFWVVILVVAIVGFGAWYFLK